MAILKGPLKQNVEITEETSLLGEVVGNITLRAGASLQIHGVVTGNIHMERGSEVVVHGVVNGDIYHRTGSVHVYGTINGRVVNQ